MSFLGFSKLSKLSALIVKGAPLLLMATLSTTYINYSSNKEVGSDQFDFIANDISESEIVLDGVKDNVYAPLAVDFGLKSTSAGYDCRLFTYHGDQALYLFFDVIDKYVTKRAIGSNNAQDEDGVEISIDCFLNGGTTPQTDDLKIYIDVSSFTKVLRGTGTAWGSSEIGFGGSLKSKLKDNTTPNDNSDIDEGYCMEYRIPYSSISGEANKETPLAFAFVHASLNDVTGSRTRTGMSGHPKFKVPTADQPGSFPVLTSDDCFYTRNDYRNLNENMPTVLGKVVNNNNEPLENVNINGYYSKKPRQIYSRKTDKNGYFTFEDVKTDDDFIVTAKKNGLLSHTLKYDSSNLVNANGAEYYQEFKMISQTTATSSLSGSIAAPNNQPLSGFKVSLLGYLDSMVTTDDQGRFNIDIYKNNENVLIVEKAGFETKLFEVDEQKLIGNTIKMFSKTITLAKPVTTTLVHNYVNAGISRDETGIYLKAESPYIIKDNEVLSLYLNTGNKSSFDNDYANGDYRIDYVNESLEIYKFSEDAHQFSLLNNVGKDVEVNVTYKVLYETAFYLPYDLFELDSNDTIGAAIGFFDGNDYQNNFIGDEIAKDGELDTSSTATYLRFDSEGNVYFGNNNVDTKFLYYYHGVDGAVAEDIPNNADRIYMTYERDDSGIEMKIVVNGNFSTHFNTSYNIAGIEAINILFNIDGLDLTAWALSKKGSSCYDFNLRIYSDDTICYVNSGDLKNQGSNQMWWSDAAHNNGVAKNFTLNSKTVSKDKYEIEKHAGYSVYTLKFSYDDLLLFGGAPSNTTLTASDSIGTLIYEVSETSKTTIRFYTSSGDAWLFKNKSLQKTIGVFSSQANYVSLEKNK